MEPRINQGRDEEAATSGTAEQCSSDEQSGAAALNPIRSDPTRHSNGGVLNIRLSIRAA